MDQIGVVLEALSHNATPGPSTESRPPLPPLEPPPPPTVAATTGLPPFTFSLS